MLAGSVTAIGEAHPVPLLPSTLGFTPSHLKKQSPLVIHLPERGRRSNTAAFGPPVHSAQLLQRRVASEWPLALFWLLLEIRQRRSSPTL